MIYTHYSNTAIEVVHIFFCQVLKIDYSGVLELFIVKQKMRQVLLGVCGVLLRDS